MYPAHVRSWTGRIGRGDRGVPRGRRGRQRPARSGLRSAAAAALAAVALLAAGARPPVADAAPDSPVVLSSGAGLFEQFGYAPAYTRNVPAFDAGGNAYLRSRTSSANETSYVHTRVGGEWVRLDFLAALRAAFPAFDHTVGAGGPRSDGIVFDREDRAYNPLTVELHDGTTRNALLVSWDRCRTWKVFDLPEGSFAVEHWVGHNEIDGPPFLAVWRTSGPPDVPGSQTNSLWVTQPRLDGETLVVPPLVRVSTRCLGISRDAGGASFAVTRAGKTWFVWSEVTPRGERGTPHFVAAYDHATGTVTQPLRLATTPDRSDTHDVPGICLDSAGYLHVVAGAHGSPALYTRSRAPLDDAAGWTAPLPVLTSGWVRGSDPSQQLGRQTYPAFVCDGSDTLHLVTRQWRRGVDDYHPGATYGALVHQSCPAGGTWGLPTVVVVAADAGYCIFSHKLALDARDRLFLSCSYEGGGELRAERARETAFALLGRSESRPGRHRNRMLLVSDDGGAEWRFATDADLTAPGETVATGAGASPAAALTAQAAPPAAAGWRWLNPTPVGNQFTALSFAGRRTGWAVGTHGTIGRTTDAGVTWAGQSAPTTADLFAVAAADVRHAWAVGGDGTILATADGGATWAAQWSSTTLDLFGVCAVSATRAWAVGERGAVVCTENGGASWSLLDAPTALNLVGVSFTARGEGIVCGGKGLLLRTRDGGLTWRHCRSGVPGALFAADLAANGRAAVAGQGGAVLVSADHGRTWRQLATGTQETVRAVAVASSGALWALAPDALLLRAGTPARRSPGQGDARSAPRAARWVRRPLPVPGTCGGLAVLDARRMVVGGAGGALCRSDDGGATWTTAGAGVRTTLRAAAQAGAAVWLAGDEGALLSVDPENETIATRTIAGGADLSGIARSERHAWAVGKAGVVAATDDAGSTWSARPSPTEEDLTAVAAPSRHTVVVAGTGGTLLTSTDDGVGWRRADAIPHDVLCLWFTDALDGWAGGGATFGEALAELAHTTDGGQTWRALDLPLWGRVRGLCFTDARTGWVAAEDWGVDGDRPQGAVMATVDGGATWTRQATVAAVLQGVAVAADGTGWAWGEHGCVLRTVDGGGGWEVVDPGTDSSLFTGLLRPEGEVWLAGADGALLAGANAGP